MIEIRTYDRLDIDDSLFKYAVIVSRHNARWTFVRHESRDTWEFPGGHREEGEDILEAAKRELIEESGATKFQIEEVCAYSVTIDNETSYGLLCYADVVEYGAKLMLEICERREFDLLPDKLTYPKIVPRLFEEVKTYIENRQ